MKIRVTKGDIGTGYWYSGMLGEIFDVIDDKGSMYTVHYEEGTDRPYGISKKHCVVVEEPTDTPQPLAEAYPKYYKDVRNLDSVDVYAVHRLFAIDDPSGAIHHASKKLLLSGVRTGGKSKYDDVREARDTLNRWLAMYDEKGAN